MTLEKGFYQRIDDHFSLHIAGDTKDVLSKLVELNTKVHGEIIRDYIENTFLRHPNKEKILWLYIKNNNSDEIISSINIIPLEWEMKNLVLSICEMGFVGTLEEYRGKGFIGILNNLYEKIMKERGYIFSVIRGIPYYYRRLGYEFAIPLDERITLPVDGIPNDDLGEIKIRKANQQDLEFIKDKYNQFHENYFIRNKFDDDCFTYRFLNDTFNDTVLSTFIIEDKEVPVAYFSLGMSHDNAAYSIYPSQLKSNHMIKILQYINELNQRNEKTSNSNIPLHINYETDFGKYLVQLGGITHNTYGWWIKIPDLKFYFESIKPIIESRIENSIFQGYSSKIIISNYSETVELIFQNGKISEINSTRNNPNLEECDVCCPGSILNKLILCDKSMEEISYIMPDAMIKDSSKLLIEAIFPKKLSYPNSYI